MSGLVLDVYGYLTMLNRKINLHGKNKGSSVTYVGIATLHYKLITQLFKVNKKTLLYVKVEICWKYDQFCQQSSRRRDFKLECWN